ncbi:PREDICTED: auxin-responsive protein IAA32 isoform X2 [Nelumbo nucifera]|uniref:Auxin-responsive protein n=1 Tax=Nelumbo nucifera TaxID=4432 RepID=A0A1U8AN49_NELNU|nr:PREDICTED: auxin-responsive protein IAA32 isoform X2 [Nelumbo nucifera]
MSSHNYFGFHQAEENNMILDLDLSLGTSLHPESCYLSGPSGHFVSSAGCGDQLQLNLHTESSNLGRPMMTDCSDEAEGVLSKEQQAYVKVNMEGVVVGRKVSMLDHASYFSLAIQLEYMFGRHCASGLRLFEDGSKFSLFYKDSDENWRTAGDVPWKSF